VTKIGRVGSRTPLAVLVSVVLVVGCGVQSTARRIAAQAELRTHATGASCTKVGIMLFVGQRQDVYDCRLTNVDIEQRPAAQIDSSTIHRCYVYANGDVYDVTTRLKALSDSGTDTSSLPCVQGSKSLCPDGRPPVAQRPNSDGKITYLCHDGSVVRR
jgi:hypothetical protein